MTQLTAVTRSNIGCNHSWGITDVQSAMYGVLAL